MIFKLFNTISSNFYKSIFSTFICSILIIYIIFNPELCLKSALDGSKLFIKSVFVSLFPFLVLINIMISYNAVNIYSKCFGNILCKPLRLPQNCSLVLIISILCGYPLGAKYACDLYEKNLIDFKTCERLISIASNPSPLFVIGSVGTYMLNNHSLGFILLISCYLSCFIIGIILPASHNNPSSKHIAIDYVCENRNIGDVLNKSINNALKTSISIGGFVIFFSVITTIVKNNILFDIVFTKLSDILSISQKSLEGFLLGLLEMTNGCNLVSSSNDFSILFKIMLLSFLLGFSGLSIISQVYSIIYKFKFSINKYIKLKFIQGIISSILTLLLYKIDIIYLSSSVFNIPTKNISMFNLNNIFIFSLLVLITPFAITKFHKLLHRIS
nr:sporulation integral membrane protein YlbJ [Clostridium sp. ZS2-4]